MPSIIDIAQDTTTQILAQTLTPDYVAGDIGTLTAKAAWNVTTNLNGDAVNVDQAVANDIKNNESIQS